ncbi:60S ribosomal protein L13 [Rasamsonia emersonii CBS 393.64]|uniref:60S ribosomal protein L13 n=1 Tax=Rasamsonia emersonii (strain ATCC 16479 / CBS 393.64 / IMI 116815) TaxID=1408163 RepID=A0A0F4YWM9_RASE3|nr:60S ribosomal protein L13 [Rasamsonia emersonii CBS 393.64]KKA22043.1 60S ribosomal protein L13 [Rasamsonia emersonii CBS 393.64]
MAIKHNNAIPNNHFHKHWQRRVRVHFDQPGRKHRRRQARLEKAAAVAPRPVDKLRPIVRCPTIKYNRKVRAGRGFTLQELKVFFNSPRRFPLARTIYCAHFSAGNFGKLVSPASSLRPLALRSTTAARIVSQESLAANVARLKEYKARLILFPRKSGQFKKLDSSPEEVKAAKEAFAAEGKVEGYATRVQATLPIKNITREEAITEIKRDEMPEGEKAAYRRLREARSEARLVGVREKRAKAKAEEESAKK